MLALRKILKSYWPLILIIIISGIIFFSRLDKDLFWDWDECLYGQYAKEIGQTGYLSNKWNGNIDLQKPPLYTWLLQIPQTFSSNEVGLRSLTLIAALGLIVAVYVFAKRYFSTSVAILSTFILLASELFVIYSTKLTTDIFFTLFIFLAFFSWIASFKKNKYSYLSGMFLGLAVMVKGLGSLQFLFAMALSIFLNFKRAYFVNIVKTTAVFLVVIIPWHIAVYLQHGAEFIKVYFLENIVKRSNYPIEFHRERWYFYFLLLYKELFPWILLSIIFPLLYLGRLRQFLSIKALKKELKDNQVIFTILLFILIPLASIVKVKTRIAWYALPIYPFIALFLAYYIDLFFKKIKLPKAILVVILLVGIDASRLMIHENRVLTPQEKISVRNAAALAASKQPQKTLEYLVAFGERQAKTVLPPEEQIPQTWVFGGNPCAVYYSGKNVKYYYTTDEFEKRLQQGKGLFLIENGDLHYVEKLPIKVLFKNTDFTLFQI